MSDPVAENAELVVGLKTHLATAWEQSDVQLREALSKSLTVAFLGSASSGKDSAIRALFGLDFGDISPIPGSTDRLRVAKLDPAGKVLLVNAPGFGDVRGEVDAVARQVLDTLDIVVYVVNCEGGATIDEKRDLDAIRERGRPVLVALNKIDLIRASQRDEFVTATLAQLGVDAKDAVVCAFDPLPQLSPEPIGIDHVIEWIAERLNEGGKGLLFAKHLRNKAAACEPIIARAARTASVAGAVPIPGADLAAVTAVQVKLIRDIAEVHGIEVDREVAVFIIGQVLTGGMKGFLRWGVEALKTAGFIPGTQFAEGAILALGSVVAGASTYGVGKAAVAWMQRGGKIEVDALRNIFDLAAWDYKKRKELPHP